jgi:phage-related protein
VTPGALKARFDSRAGRKRGGKPRLAETTRRADRLRVFYHVGDELVLVLGVFRKKTQATPKRWTSSNAVHLGVLNERAGLVPIPFI